MQEVEDGLGVSQVHEGNARGEAHRKQARSKRQRGAKGREDVGEHAARAAWLARLPRVVLAQAPLEQNPQRLMDGCALLDEIHGLM